MATVFLSYKSDDREYAEKLYRIFCERGLTDVFWDKECLRGGEYWENRLYYEIERCYVVVLLITPRWIQAPWTVGEYIVARYHNRMIVPVLIDGVTQKDIQGKIDGAIHYIEGFNEQRIVDDVKSLIESNANNVVVWKDVPYPGLASYEEYQSPIFFGRKQEVLDITDSCRKLYSYGKKVLVLQAASGSGKSSLLKAGLVHSLKKEIPYLRVLPVFRPEKHPLKALHAVLCAESQETLCNGKTVDTLIDVVKKRHNVQGIWLIVDQAEELFVFPSKEEQQTFIDTMSRLINDRDDVFVVMALRADYADYFQQNVLAKIDRKRTVIEPLQYVSRDGLYDIIVGPTKLPGVEVVIEDRLVQVLMREFSDTKALPILAVTLRKLYDKAVASEDKTMRLLEYRSGSFSDMIDEEAEEALQDALHGIEDADKDNALTSFKETLINFFVRYDNERVLKQKVPTDVIELTVMSMIETFVRRRLIIGDTEGFEFVHEALLSRWRRLAEWIEEGREFLRIKKRVEEAYEEWCRAEPNRKNESLLHGTLLDLAQRYQKKFFSPDLRAYIQASSEYDHKRRKERRALVFGAFAVVTAGGAFSSWQWYRADKAESQISKQALLLQEEVRQAKHNVGLMFAEKAKLLVDELRIGRAQLNACAALRFLDWDASDNENLTTLIGILECYPRTKQAFIGTAHTHGVYSIGFYNDKTAISSSEDGSVVVWDTPRGKVKKQFFSKMKRQANIKNVVFDSQCLYMGYGTFLGKCRLDDSAEEVALVYNFGEQIQRVRWLDKPNVMVVGLRSSKLVIFDVNNSRVLYTSDKKHQDILTDVCVDRQRNSVYVASYDGRISVWSISNATLHFERFVEFDKNTRIKKLWVADKGLYASSEYIVKFFRFPFDTYERIYTSVDILRTFCLDANDTVMYIAKSDGKIVFYDTASKQLREVIDFNKDKNICLEERNGTLLGASWDETVRFFDLSAYRTHTLFDGHRRWAYVAVFLPNGDILSSGKDKIILRWSKNDKGHYVVRRHYVGHFGSVYDIVVIDERTFASSSVDKNILIWDTKESRPKAVLKGHHGTILTLAYDKKRRRLFSASRDKSVRMWRFDSEKNESETVLKFYSQVYRVVYLPRYNAVAASTLDGDVAVFDLCKHRFMLRRKLPQKGVFSLSVDRSGRYLYAGVDDGTIYRWDMDKHFQEITLPQAHTNRIYTIVFSHDGKWMFTASRDKRIIKWDLVTYQSELLDDSHTKRIYHLDIAKDDRYLVSASWDQALHIIDVHSTDKTILRRYVPVAVDGRSICSRASGRCYTHETIESLFKQLSKEYQIKLEDAKLVDAPQPYDKPEWSPTHPFYKS